MHKKLICRQCVKNWSTQDRGALSSLMLSRRFPIRGLTCKYEVACPLGYSNCGRVDYSLRYSWHYRGIDHA